jgi:hypothetical protein
VIGAIVAKTKVREGFDCLNERNLAKWITYGADNALLFYPGTLSLSGKIEGKQANAAYYEKFSSNFRPYEDLKNLCLEAYVKKTLLENGGSRVSDDRLRQFNEQMGRYMPPRETLTAADETVLDIQGGVEGYNRITRPLVGSISKEEVLKLWKNQRLKPQ